MKQPTVLIADDHRLVAEAIKGILEPTYEVVGIVEDGRALVQSAHKLAPDVVLVDVNMPLLNGLEAGKQIKKSMPRTKVVVLTMDAKPRLVAEAFRWGISAYVLKHAAAKELLQALQEALKGRTYISKEFGISLPDLLTEHQPTGSGEQLTARQIEVIQLLAEGRSMKEAADILHISVRTIADHKYRIMAQLGLKSNAELFQYAAKHGIVSV